MPAQALHTPRRPILRRHRRLTMVLGLLLTTLLTGCGGGNSDACHECVIVPINGTQVSGSAIPPGGATGVLVGGNAGVLFKVQASASDPTPVAGATVSLWTTAEPGTHTMFADENRTIMVGDGDFWQTTTNDVGTVRIFTSADIPSCLALSLTKDGVGLLTVSAAISNSQANVTADLTLKCSPAAP